LRNSDFPAKFVVLTPPGRGGDGWPKKGGGRAHGLLYKVMQKESPP